MTHHIENWEQWEVRAVLKKWDSEDDYNEGVEPVISRFGKERLGDGLVTNLGGKRMWRLIRGDAVATLNYTNTRVGIGCDTDTPGSPTAPTVSQTDLVASGGPGVEWRQADFNYPAVEGESGPAPNAPADQRDIAITVTLGSTEGNIDSGGGQGTGDWLEFGVAIDAAGADGANNLTGTGVMLDRFTSNQGRKVLGQVWELTVTLGFRAAA